MFEYRIFIYEISYSQQFGLFPISTYGNISIRVIQSSFRLCLSFNPRHSSFRWLTYILGRILFRLRGRTWRRFLLCLCLLGLKAELRAKLSHRKYGRFGNLRKTFNKALKCNGNRIRNKFLTKNFLRSGSQKINCRNVDT